MSEASTAMPLNSIAWQTRALERVGLLNASLSSNTWKERMDGLIKLDSTETGKPYRHVFGLLSARSWP